MAKSTSAANQTVNVQHRSSMREVAELAGVAMSSVSRVLGNHPDVSVPMREKVLAAVRQLEYSPDLLAKSLRSRETHSIGFMVGDISNPLFAQIAKGAESIMREAGYSVLLTNSRTDPELDSSNLSLFGQRRVDGLILSLASEDHAPTLDLLRKLTIPIVVVDRTLPPDIHVRRVISDHRSGISEAVDHLVHHGHTRIGLAVGHPVRPAIERRLGFEDALARHELPATDLVKSGTFSSATGAETTRAFLDSPNPPTAIIAGGNQIMIGALRVLAERGLELGRDISFVGCDDVAITELHRPSISVIKRNNEEMGQAAAQLLLEALRGDFGDAERMLPTQFVPRKSSGAVSPTR